jgi:hypothetical protein
MRRLALLVLGLWLAAPAHAGTRVSLWHSYTNQSHEVHFAFDLKNYKRGLFFGSCGPSTYSLQWEYGFDLKGKGPEFTNNVIELKDGNLQPVNLDSGKIAVDERKQTIHISIKVSTNGAPQDFIGNGTYKLRSKL